MQSDSEHVGCYEFCVDPDNHIEVVMQNRRKLDELSRALDPNAPQSNEDKAWDNMPPVGMEFGSQDYESLMEQDQINFQLTLSGLIQECRDLTQSSVHELEDDEHQYAVNVQIALQELGQHVSLEVAAEVWRHHSRSLKAGWMAGAETIASAKRTLFFYSNNWQRKSK